MRTNCPDCKWTTRSGVQSLKACAECLEASLANRLVKVESAFVFHRRIRDHRMAVRLWENSGREGSRPTLDFPEADDDSQLPGFEWPEVRPHCFRCSKDMRAQAYAPNAEFITNDVFDGSQETQNECTLLFSGGYGSFVDTAFEGMPTLTICHECGHELAEWLGLDPRNWHTHSIHGGQHPDHHDHPEA